MKKALYRFLASLLLAQLSFSAIGQIKPQVLRAIDIVDSQNITLESSYAQVFDSLNIKHVSTTNDLTMFLSRQTPMHFKHYGPGLLATPTFRGGDANHTQVLWNGLPINSPMLGTLDISTLPVSAFNKIAVLGANASNLHSTGGLGGSISLEQNVSFNQNYSWVETHIASAETHGGAAGINIPFKIGNTNLVYRMHSDFINSKNAFSYVDLLEEKNPKKINGPAAFSRENLNLQLGAIHRENLQVSLIYWYNSMERELPNPINIPPGTAEQLDKVHRTLLETTYFLGPTLNFNFKSFFELNSNQFTDSSLAIANNNNYRQFQQEASINWEKSKWPSIEARARYSYINAETQSYADKQRANGVSGVLVTRYDIWKSQVLFEAGYRFEQFIADKALLPFGGIRLNHHKLKPFYFFTSASETVRFATLNERFWVPGGNINLESEKGTSVEAGLGYEKMGVKFGFTAFNANYFNRIRWLPSGSVFTPTNVSFSRSKGLESFIGYSKHKGHHHIEIYANGTLISAIGRTREQAPLYLLSFIPQQSANGWVTYRHKHWSVRYAIRYMGKRFISNDETAYMPHFIIQDFGLDYLLNTKEISWTWNFGIENIADWNYQVMPWRPMPGRMFTCSIRMQWSD